MAKKKKVFDAGKELKAIARERVGRIPSPKLIEPKTLRKKPKYKASPLDESAAQ